MRKVQRQFLIITVILIIAPLTSCMTLMTDPAPPTGHATHEFEGTRVSMVLPVSARGRQMPSPAPNVIGFGNEVEDDHTVAASVLIGEKTPASRTDQEQLEWWWGEQLKELPKAPGRKGAVLRSIERIGGTRSQEPAEGAHCIEYVWISEDRLVPGHKGEPFVLHAHEYVCIHSGTHVLIRSSFSERFSAKRSEVRPTLDEDSLIL